MLSNLNHISQMFARKDNVHDNNISRVNGIKKFESTKKKDRISIKMSDILQVNEWSVTFLLFVISLSITLVKLYTNYGNVWKSLFEDQYNLTSMSALFDRSSTFNVSSVSNLSEIFPNQLLAASTKFINVSSQCEETVVNVAVTYYDICVRFMKAMISGLIMTGFTWYIIYKDSDIPGINPPSPISLFKRRTRQCSHIPINYLVGALNGIMVFICMCL